MQWCKGGDLNTYLLNHREERSLQDILPWLLDLTVGLNHVHQSNFAHRNLNKVNVFLKDKGLVIGDFGSAALPEDPHLAEAQQKDIIALAGLLSDIGGHLPEIDDLAKRIRESRLDLSAIEQELRASAPDQDHR